MADFLTDLDVAIVHDWFPLIGGGEKVVKEMTHCFAKSEIYTVFDFLSEEERMSFFEGRSVHVSALNRLPGVEYYYRYLLLQATRAIEAFDVSHHDVVISSSAAISKGVITSPEQKHFAYVHSPARYAWDLTHEYMSSLDGFAVSLKRMIAREMMHRFRIWDQRTPPLVDQFIANSDFIRKRIWKVYRREAEVIYPPVDIDAFSLSQKPREEFFFTASRMVPYKRIPMIVEAFTSRPDLRLVVAGDGPDMAKVRALAGDNITILGQVSQATLIDHLHRCRSFVFAAKEDFGIAPVEAQACGAPVVAFGKGGATETVHGLNSATPTGVHFDEQTPHSLLRGVDRLISEEGNLRRNDIRSNAEDFSPAKFRARLTSLVLSQL